MNMSTNFLAKIGLFAFSIFTLSILFAYCALDSIDDDHNMQMASLVVHHGYDFHLRNQKQHSHVMMRKGHKIPASEKDGVEKDVPDVTQDVKNKVNELRLDHPIETVDKTLTYDIHKCPSEIPEGYPIQWSVLEVLSYWNPDNMTIPDEIHQGLCELDWTSEEERSIALKYREAELPFVLHNHPTTWKAAERWSNRKYLSNRLKNKKQRNEHSTGNHMPYWKPPKHGKIPDWKPPTENVKLTFDEWYDKAMELETVEDPIHAHHWYFRLNGMTENKAKNDWIYEDLPFFLPKKNFFMVQPEDYRGINCRLGSKGIIAETHYDFSRNFILILRGQKRYVLAHPNQCQNLELHPPGHPSARHSSVNWSDPSAWGQGNFPQAMVNEVIMQAGDILYLPTAWFHFIVSLNMNYQCNARSGITLDYEEDIQDCGFK